MAKRKVRVMVKAILDEISAVDVPAAEGARAVLAKRAPMAKRVAMTDVAAGHVHTLRLGSTDDGFAAAGSTSYERTAGSESGHSHQWIRSADGAILIGEAEGHTHAIAAVTKNTPDPAPAGSEGTNGAGDSTPSENQMTPEQLAAQAAEALAKMQKRAERAEAVSLLTDAEKAIFASRDSAGQDLFLKMAPADRANEVAAVAKAAADKDPVVFTDLDGVDYRASDDKRLVAMAKGRDLDRKAAAQAAETARVERIQRLAKGLEHLPGTDEDHQLLVEAVETLPLAKRAPALAALTALDASMAKAFSTIGTRGEQKPAPTSFDGKLDAMAKSLREKNPALTQAQAEVKALESEEGREIYSQYLAEAHSRR